MSSIQDQVRLRRDPRRIGPRSHGLGVSFAVWFVVSAALLVHAATLRFESVGVMLLWMSAVGLASVALAIYLAKNHVGVVFDDELVTVVYLFGSRDVPRDGLELDPPGPNPRMLRSASVGEVRLPPNLGDESLTEIARALGDGEDGGAASTAEASDASLMAAIRRRRRNERWLTGMPSPRSAVWAALTAVIVGLLALLGSATSFLVWGAALPIAAASCWLSYRPLAGADAAKKKAIERIRQEGAIELVNIDLVARIRPTDGGDAKSIIVADRTAALVPDGESDPIDVVPFSQLRSLGGDRDSVILIATTAYEVSDAGMTQAEVRALFER